MLVRVALPGAPRPLTATTSPSAAGPLLPVLAALQEWGDTWLLGDGTTARHRRTSARGPAGRGPGRHAVPALAADPLAAATRWRRGAAAPSSTATPARRCPASTACPAGRAAPWSRAPTATGSTTSPTSAPGSSGSAPSRRPSRRRSPAQPDPVPAGLRRRPGAHDGAAAADVPAAGRHRGSSGSRSSSTRSGSCAARSSRSATSPAASRTRWRWCAVQRSVSEQVHDVQPDQPVRG